MIKELVD